MSQLEFLHRHSAAGSRQYGVASGDLRASRADARYPQGVDDLVSVRWGSPGDIHIPGRWDRDRDIEKGVDPDVVLHLDDYGVRIWADVRAVLETQEEQA